MRLRSSEPELKKKIYKFLPFAVEIALEHKIDPKYETEIMSAANNTSFQPLLIDIFPQVIFKVLIVACSSIL